MKFIRVPVIILIIPLVIVATIGGAARKLADWLIEISFWR